MSISLSSISRGKARRSPRVVLLGVEKIGKSTFAAQAPGAVFIPIRGEEGVDELDVPKFPVVGSFAELMETLQALAVDAHDFRTVVIDSASTLEPLIWDQTCRDNNAPSIEKVGGGFGKGYIEALKYWREVQAALDYLRDAKGMGCVIVGHVKVKTFNDPLTDPYDQYQFDVQERAANLWYRWADAILFANRKTFAKTVKQTGDNKTVHATGTDDRYLYTDKRPAHPGGTRYGLPYEMKFRWADFEAAVNASREPVAAA